MENRFDKEIQELFKAYEEQPSANCWDKVSSQLDAMQNIPDASQEAANSSANTSAFTQFAGSIAGKITIAVASVAAIGGLSYLIISNSDSSNTSPTITDTASNVEILIDDNEYAEDTISQVIVEQSTTSNEVQKPVIVQNSSISEEKQQIQKEENENRNASNSVSENNSVTQNQPVITQVAEPKNQPKEAEKQQIAQKQETVKPKQEKKEISEKQKIVQEQSNTNTEIPKEEQIQENPPIDVSKIPISNLLTPNGAGYNDYFIISNIDEYPENNLVVFGKDGKVVYERPNYRNEWNGENVSDGVYYYIFSFFYEGKTFMRRGSITIRR